MQPDPRGVQEVSVTWPAASGGGSDLKTAELLLPISRTASSQRLNIKRRLSNPIIVK